MTRRFETGRRCLLAAAVLLSAACQSEAAPQLQSEPAARAGAAAHPLPSAASAPGAAAPGATAPGAGVEAPSAGSSASAAAAPAARSGAVGLAKYEAVPAGTAAAGSAAAAPAADGPATKPAGQAVQGAAISEEPFSIWLQSVSPIPAGSAATVEAVLVAKPPYHCNPDYPHKFKLAAAPAGVTYPEATVKGAKVTAERSVLAIPVRAENPGKAKVTGTLSFSVCNDERCLVEKRELSVDLEVK